VNEHDFKAKAVAALRQEGLTVFSHEDRYTPGVPDLSATGNGRTSWIEAKVLEESDFSWCPAESAAHRMPHTWEGWGEINFARHFGSHAKGHFRMQQLMKLCELQGKGVRSEYAIGVLRSKKLYVVVANPSDVLTSVRENRFLALYYYLLNPWAERIATGHEI
jgi:hypothetical protein